MTTPIHDFVGVTSVPHRLCPWCAIPAKSEAYLARNQDPKQRHLDLRSACSFVTCPECGVQKGLILEAGNEDLAAAEKDAWRLWDTRREAP